MRLWIRSALTVALLLAARPAPAWVTTANGAGNTDDRGEGIAVTASGDVVVLANLRSLGGGGGNDFNVLKLDGGSGAVLWSATMGTDGSEGYDLSVDATGDVYAAGAIKVSLSGEWAFTVVKLDGASGGELWRYSVPVEPAAAGYYAWARALRLDASAGLYAMGSRALSSTVTALVIARLDPTSGAETWRTEISGIRANASTRVFPLDLDPAGNLLVTGAEQVTRVTRVLKLDAATGGILWDLSLAPAYSSSVASDSLGDALLVMDNIQVTKLSGVDGDALWTWIPTGTDFGIADIAVASNDDMLAAGVTDGSAMVVRVDGTSGLSLWMYTGVGTGDPALASQAAFGALALTPDGDVMATGHFTNRGSFADLAVVKISSDSGIEAWRWQLQGSLRGDAADIGIAIAATDENGAAVTGDIRNAGGTDTDLVAARVGGPVSGRKISFTQSDLNSNRNKLTVDIRDRGLILPSPGGAADPTLVGASLVLFNPVSAETDTYALPAANWTVSGDVTQLRGYAYRDSETTAGPCKSIKLRKGGRLKVKCAGPSLAFTLDEASQGALGISLQFDTLDACALFGGLAKHDTSSAGGNVGRFVAANAQEPAACQAP